MSTNFTSPVMRLVQGGVTLRPKKDDKGNPVIEDGKPVHECFMALAIPKNDPLVQQFYALYVQQARESFASIINADGTARHPRFAWKVQDGDGNDANGKSVADKPGFAGHYVFKMATRFAPKCYIAGKYAPHEQLHDVTDASGKVIQSLDEIIKRGYYVRVMGTIDGNGVDPNGNGQAVPGLFVSPNAVELVWKGEEIQSGPDVAQGFGAAPIQQQMPQGAAALPGNVVQSAPAGVGAGLSPPPLPGAGGAPASIGAPNAGVATPAVGGLGAPPVLGAPAGLGAPPTGLGAPPGGLGAPPQQTQPQFTMQATAMGASREQLHAQGWTDEQLIANGHMVRNW